MPAHVIRIVPSKNISIWKLFESAVPYCGTLSNVTTARSLNCDHQTVPPDTGFKSSYSPAMRGRLKWPPRLSPREPLPDVNVM